MTKLSMKACKTTSPPLLIKNERSLNWIKLKTIPKFYIVFGMCYLVLGIHILFDILCWIIVNSDANCTFHPCLYGNIKCKYTLIIPLYLSTVVTMDELHETATAPQFLSVILNHHRQTVCQVELGVIAYRCYCVLSVFVKNNIEFHLPLGIHFAYRCKLQLLKYWNFVLNIATTSLRRAQLVWQLQKNILSVHEGHWGRKSF
jgi:hypothetical protein